ncbi:SIMPL domain-containing protein [Chloroflexota bacterium]
MKKNWLTGISLALVLAVVGLCGCNPSATTLGEINLRSQQEGIWVTGQGRATAVPDIVTLRLGIEAQEVTIDEAQTQAAEVMDGVMSALTESGVAEKDIQTQHFSIRQITEWDRGEEEEIVIGYRVTNMVIAKIRDIDKTGSIIDAVAGAGGDLTRINNIGFSIDDPSAYYEEAREKALSDAKIKAEQLTELAGVNLGKPTYISESISYPVSTRDYMYEVMEAPAAVPETPIVPGEMEISITVQVAYAILE